MRKLVLFGAAGVAVIAAFAACDDDEPTGPASVTYTAQLSGAKERPNPTNSTATGTATFVHTGNTVTYTVSVNGLTTPATLAHIHLGDSTVAGGILVDLAPTSLQSGTIATGSINLAAPIVHGTSTITGDSLLVLFNNRRSYVNVHTSTFPGGEIRGQVVRQ